MKKAILIFTVALMGLSLNANACDKFLEGKYFCVYKDGSYGTKTIGYGKDAEGKFLIYDKDEALKIRFNGKPALEQNDDILVQIDARCSEDQKSIIIDLKEHKTKSYLGELKLTQTNSPGMNFKATYVEEGEDEEALCYRKVQ